MQADKTSPDEVVLIWAENLSAGSSTSNTGCMVVLRKAKRRAGVKVEDAENNEARLVTGTLTDRADPDRRSKGQPWVRPTGSWCPSFTHRRSLYIHIVRPSA